MKSIFAFLFAAFIFQSCSTCYECKQEIVINGKKEWSDPEERCSADGSEITELEKQGYVCSQS